MSETPRLGLPQLAAAQAQKHVTVNEALSLLDALVQIGVKDRDLAAPPGTPSEGDLYIVAAGATGAWAGWEDAIALWSAGAWRRIDPGEGWLAWVEDESGFVRHAASGWSLWPSNVSTFGVNAEADATNRLVVASAATLLTHEGDGHQLKINKAAAGDTASVLFQTSFSGRAEFGLSGDDNWRVKVSPDGVSWSEAVTVMAASGFVGIGATDPQAPLHVEGDDAALLLGNSQDPSALWTIAPGRPGFYEDFLIVAVGADYSDPATHRLRLPGGAAPPVFAEGVSVPDGKRFASESSAALAHYVPFQGTRGELTFRGPTGTGKAHFRFAAFYHDGSAWATRIAGGFEADAAGARLGVGTDAPSTTIHAEGPVRVGSFTVATLPSASAAGAGSIIFVSDEAGGAVLAFSDGSDWRRSTDRAVVS